MISIANSFEQVAKESPSFIDSKASIKLSKSDLGPCINYLLEAKISFEIQYAPLKAYKASHNLDDHTPVSTPSEQSNIVSHSYNLLIRNTYQKYIIDGIGNIPPPEVLIAAELGLSPYFFKKHFNEIYGKPFYQCYMEKKMDYAKKLLRQGLRASQVSEQIGYSHPIKFNKMFQKCVGMTPKKYQKMNISTR